MPSTTYLLASLYTTAKTLLVRARTSRGSPQMNKVFRALGVPVSPAIARCFFTVARVDVYSADDFALGRFANDRCRNYARGPMSRRCRSASASICTFVFPPYFFFFFFLPHPSFDRIREPKSFRLPRGVTPWRIFSPVSPRAIRSRGSSGWIFNEAIYTGFVICTDQANLLGIENFNFLDLFVQFFGHLFSSPRTRVLQYPPFLLNLLY